ncbi:MAG: DUF2835 domain-containing protein [Gammaproteobacteria bacterium]|nr:MAG: DUF2835 domain-containing protein [Gammaproteobacteria bacterium]
MVSEFQFSLKLSQQKYLQYYAGEKSSVQVRSNEGLLIQFPASALKPWVTHHGVQGHFAIRFDKDNKLTSLKKLADLS